MNEAGNGIIGAIKKLANLLLFLRILNGVVNPRQRVEEKVLGLCRKLARG